MILSKNRRYAARNALQWYFWLWFRVEYLEKEGKLDGSNYKAASGAGIVSAVATGITHYNLIAANRVADDDLERRQRWREEIVNAYLIPLDGAQEFVPSLGVHKLGFSSHR